MPRHGAFVIGLLCLSQFAARCAAVDCSMSDTNLQKLQRTYCASFSDAACSGGDKAEQDWPNQVVYMRELLSALAAPSTCLNTTIAASMASWLATNQCNMSDWHSWYNTWDIFQVQYFDMPRKAGVRIESADTLGRKCWAFAYLHQVATPVLAAAAAALGAAGLSLGSFWALHNRSVPLTMGLCERVMANCFVNASFDPTRNGTCPLAITRFHVLGFDRENLLRRNVVEYPFSH